ncbi:MAG: DUF2383 domain-containing protein [Flavobacteriaceae bacterium]
MGRYDLKDREKVLNNLYALILLNTEVSQIYKEAAGFVRDSKLKAFFVDRSRKRNDFAEVLIILLLKFQIEPVKHSQARGRVHDEWNYFKLHDAQKSKSTFLRGIYKVKRFSLTKYNELLRENKLPLPLCKTLIRHRDNIQNAMNKVKRQEQLENQ